MASSLDQLEKSHGVDIAWRSYELRPKGAAPISPEYRARIEAGRPRLYEIARQRYGLELQPGPFGFDSRPALVGAKFAEQQGVGKQYHARIMAAYWLEGQDIGDTMVLAEIAEAIGLERNAFLTALQESGYTDAVDQDIQEARTYGLNGVPALVFDMKYLVSGAQPYDVLVNVVDQIRADESGESDDESSAEQDFA